MAAGTRAAASYTGRTPAGLAVWLYPVMARVTLTVLKQYLAGLSADELGADLADLFVKLDVVKDYYTLRLNGSDEDVAASYKARIKNEFFPARGYGQARLSVARKAVNDYKRLAPPASLAELMVYYVEMGVAFTNAYGDISEPFYSSMEKMYASAADYVAKHGLRAEFQARCKRIVADTSGIGWGFHDMLSQIYDEYFPDEYFE